MLTLCLQFLGFKALLLLLSLLFAFVELSVRSLLSDFNLMFMYLHKRYVILFVNTLRHLLFFLSLYMWLLILLSFLTYANVWPKKSVHHGLIHSIYVRVDQFIVSTGQTLRTKRCMCTAVRPLNYLSDFVIDSVFEIKIKSHGNYVRCTHNSCCTCTPKNYQPNAIPTNENKNNNDHFKWQQFSRIKQNS